MIIRKYGIVAYRMSQLTVPIPLLIQLINQRGNMTVSRCLASPYKQYSMRVVSYISTSERACEITAIAYLILANSDKMAMLSCERTLMSVQQYIWMRESIIYYGCGWRDSIRVLNSRYTFFISSHCPLFYNNTAGQHEDPGLHAGLIYLRYCLTWLQHAHTTD